MKWPIRIIAFCIVFAFWQNNTAITLEWFFPELADVYVMPFIDKSYEWPGDPRGVPLLWWIKYCCADIGYLIIMVCFTKIASYVSNRLMQIGIVFCLYCLSDGFMLWYDYKTSSNMYHFLDVAAAINVIIMFIPEKKKNPVKSIK